MSSILTLPAGRAGRDHLRAGRHWVELPARSTIIAYPP